MAEQVINQEALAGERYEERPDAWQTKVQESLKLPFPVAWLCIAGFLFAIGFFIEAYLGHNLDVSKGTTPQSNSINHPIIMLIIQCGVIAGVTNAVVYCESLLDRVADTFPLLINENSEKTEVWVRRWYNSIFWSKNNLVVGLLMAIFLTIAYAPDSGALFTSTMKAGTLIAKLGKAYSYLMTFILGFVAGSWLWTALSIAFMFFSMGKDVRIKTSIFDSKSSILRMASSLIWRISIIMTLVYLLGASVVLFCGVGKSPSSLIIMAIFGGFIIAYCIIPQVNIHKHLANLKRDRLSVLVEQIEQYFNEVAHHPTPENISHLRDLVHLQSAVNSRESWAFGMNRLLSLIGTILIPLFSILLRFIDLKKIFP